MTMSSKPTPHPAKYSPNVLTYMAAAINRYADGQLDILDPFGGVGGIHDLMLDYTRTWCIELELEWAEQAALKGATWCGDFFECAPLRLARLGWPTKFDVIATSPTYGNRMADHHVPKDASTRITYTHKLGRALSDNNSGVLAFHTNEYKLFHLHAYRKFRRLLVPGGLVLLNVSDFIAKNERVAASAWHRDMLIGLKFEHLKTYNVPTPRMRYGANAQARVNREQLHVFR